MKTVLTAEEQAFIEGYEMAMDYMLPVPDSDHIRYQELIAKRAVLEAM